MVAWSNYFAFAGLLESFSCFILAKTVNSAIIMVRRQTGEFRYSGSAGPKFSLETHLLAI
jgi:hypothetical protein